MVCTHSVTPIANDDTVRLVVDFVFRHSDENNVSQEDDGRHNRCGHDVEDREDGHELRAFWLEKHAKRGHEGEECKAAH